VRAMPAVLLLGHICEVWPDDTTFLPTAELIDLPVTRHPGVWGEEGPIGKRLTAQRLGKMLVSGYKIRSDRESNYGPRGYHNSAFTRAWSRMQTPPKLTGSTDFSGSTGSSSLHYSRAKASTRNKDKEASSIAKTGKCRETHQLCGGR
jgi:hypothetical protein